jgi:hypothetical protein
MFAALGRLLVGGTAAQQIDSVDAIVAAVPATLAFVVCVTLVLLFLAFGSLVLPVKAVLMGFLSLGASLGAVVWGFQEGHLGGGPLRRLHDRVGISEGGDEPPAAAEDRAADRPAVPVG